jgi:hypothetical protein
MVLGIAYAQWSIVFLSWSLGREYLTYVFQMGTFTHGRANIIFPLTWASALFLFCFSVFAFHKLGCSVLKATFLAFGLTFGAVSIFEDIYQNIGVFYGGHNFCRFLHIAVTTAVVRVFLYPHSITLDFCWVEQLINASAIFMVLPSAYYWKFSKTALVLFTSYIAGWLLWASIGYPQIFSPHPEVAIALNSYLKVLTFVMLISLLLPNLMRSSSLKE